MPAFVQAGSRGDTDKGSTSRRPSTPTSPSPLLWPRVRLAREQVIRMSPSSPTPGDWQSRARYIMVVVDNTSRGCTGGGGGTWPPGIQPIAGCPPPPPPGKHHYRMGLDPPPQMGWGRAWWLTAGSFATLTGHCCRAGALACGAGAGTLKLGSLPSPRCTAAAGFRARRQQQGLLPPGWAGWVAVGVGSQEGHLPTLRPALGNASSPIWGQSSGSYLPALGPPPGGGHCVPRHQEVSSQGGGWRLRAFA